MTTVNRIAEAQARRRALLVLIEQIARRGERLPGNDGFAGVLGTSRAVVEIALRRLAAEGAIEIERRGRARRIRLAKAGLITDWSRKPEGHVPVPPAGPCPTVPPPPAKGPRVIPDWVPTTCQWLNGHPRERDFCGAPVKPGSSYCPAHHARCRVPPPATSPDISERTAA